MVVQSCRGTFSSQKRLLSAATGFFRSDASCRVQGIPRCIRFLVPSTPHITLYVGYIVFPTDNQHVQHPPSRVDLMMIYCALNPRS